MNTNNCDKIYGLLSQLRELVPQLTNTIKEIEDAFCDFECGWTEHVNEYHIDEENEV